VKKAVLFDLDDTLVPEFANYGSAFAAACEELARNEDVDVERLRAAVFDTALDAWRASPVIAYCRQARLGFAQGLLSDFPGDAPEIDYLRGWAPAYRRAAWTRGLAAVGLESEPFADQLAEAFRARLAAQCPPFDDVVGALEALRGAYALAVISNGPMDVQRLKLRVAGIERFFPIVVTSGEVGFGKPHERIFAAALEALGVSADEAVMVGDHLERDIHGARRLAISGIWLNRSAVARAAGVDPAVEIASLSELAGALAAI